MGDGILLCLLILFAGIFALFIGLVAGSDATPADCVHRHRPVVVHLAAPVQRPVLRHVRRAVRHGYPRVLHIDREDADAHREASLAPYPPRTGYDRDEWPVAESREGGKGASVAYIDPTANRSAGATMGNRLRAYCDGQRFKVTG